MLAKTSTTVLKVVCRSAEGASMANHSTLHGHEAAQKGKKESAEGPLREEELV